VTLDAAVALVQFAYPQIYYACHTQHRRERTNAVHLSARDSEILVHLDRRVPRTLGELARHMDLAASTLSEAIAELVEHGYVHKQTGAGDRRRVGLLLSAKGADAVRAASVLDADRLGAILGTLSVRDRTKVVDGLRVLARACRPRP
jgi:DNA-binding MarR family transcriptional regulator